MLKATGGPFRYSIKILKVSANAKFARLGRVVHAHLIVANQVAEGKMVEITCLINFYAKCGELHTARNLFDNMLERSLVSWSALMTGYLHNGRSRDVIELLKDLVSTDNMNPNEYVFAIAISSCSSGQMIMEGKQAHGFLLKSGFELYEYVRNALVYMYTKCSSIHDAVLILNSVPIKDIASYNSILNAFVEHGYVIEGAWVLKRLIREHGMLIWDDFTFLNVLGICASLRDLELGLRVHARLLTCGVEGDIQTCNAIINMYGKCGALSHATRVFDGFQNRSVVLWTTLMGAYFQNGNFEEALNSFSEMRLQDFKPNEFTFSILLGASAGLSTVRHGSLIHADVEKSGFKDYIMVRNALINMYAKAGVIETAYKVFSGTEFRDIVTWNAIICGYAHHGLGKEALRLFRSMFSSGQVPNYVTFIGVLAACSHLGLVQESFYFLNHSMKIVGIEPGLEHYTCIVAAMGKAGRLVEAYDFMKSTPVKWDVVAWRTLLTSCQVRRNYDLGKRVANLVLEMDSSDVGTYTLLSNAYANARKWDGVAKIRKSMRDRNVKKEPGVSWIEIRNVVHVFVSGDKKHPEHDQISDKVRELLDAIKPLGYVPDVLMTMHDVEDEQKEEYLRHHSEKLAIAYGILRTPAAAPVIVIKNLRICRDCHSAAKLISCVTRRLIIVRDANRFHHFRDGCCSCADYW